MALIVIDASVLIAHFDLGDPLHGQAEATLKSHATDDLVLPASAYAEALVVSSRHGRLAVMRAQIRSLLIRIEPLSEAIAERAAELRARHRALRLPDALVIATGEELKADQVITGDRRWARVSSRVRIIS